jgi:RecA/RadA recombinase
MKTKKKNSQEKFAQDLVTSSLLNKYGDIIKSGTEVLENINQLEVISISPALDIALGGGLREGSVVVMTGDPKSGKAGSMSSLVYTTDGPKQMKNIVINDKVVTPDGSFGVVNGVFPQGVIDCFKVIFDDGTYAECSEDHLWKVKKNYHGRYQDWKILSLKDIMSEGLFYSDRPKWAIPLTNPVSFTIKNQPVDPWIIGAIIGDGGLTNKTPIITTADEEIVQKFKDFAHQNNLYLTKKGADSYSYAISNPANGVGDNALTNCLRSLGLMGLNSHYKFIPDVYKYGDIEQRFNLVKGLMDTDGFNSNGIVAEYTTVSKRLCDDFVEVVQSLGYKAKIKHRFTKSNGKEFPSYRVHISGNNVNNLFSLSRKIYNRKRIKPTLLKKIVDVQYIGKQECQCISIDHPDHLYLTNSFNVTHNTTTALHFASKCQQKNKKVIYISTEGRLARQNFEGIKGLDADKILIVESTDDRILTAEDFLNIIEYYINNDPGCLIIADSLSNMVPSQELEGEVRTGVRNALPRLLSMFFKRISGTLMKNRIILICVTHNIANTGGSPYAPAKMADCGNMLQYQAGTNMVITHRGKWQVPKDSGPHVGQIANWSIKTSNAGGRPNSTAESWIKYGIGIDEVQEVMQIACEFRLIKASGAWYTISCAVDNVDDPLIKEMLEKNNISADNKEEVERFFKFQGSNNLSEFLENNYDLAMFVYKKIKELY